MSSDSDHRIIHGVSGSASRYTDVRTRLRRGTMDSWQTSFEHHSLLFWAVLAVVVVLLAFWASRLQGANRRLEARLSDLLDGVESENTAAMLVEYLRTVRSTAAAVDRTVRKYSTSMAAVFSLSTPSSRSERRASSRRLAP